MQNKKKQAFKKINLYSLTKFFKFSHVFMELKANSFAQNFKSENLPTQKKNTFRRSEAMIKKIFNCLPTCGFGCLVYILEPTKKLFYRQHFK